MTPCSRCGGTLYDAVETALGSFCSPLCAEHAEEDRRLHAASETDPIGDPRFGLDEGRARRDEGIARVTNNTREDYSAAFESAFERCFARRRPFTSDDVTEQLSIEPHHPNAVGALMRSTAIAHGMEKVGYVPGRRKRVHAAVVAQWGHPDWGSDDGQRTAPDPQHAEQGLLFGDTEPQKEFMH